MKTQNHRRDRRDAKEPTSQYRWLSIAKALLLVVTCLATTGCLWHSKPKSDVDNRFTLITKEEAEVRNFDKDLHYAVLSTKAGTYPAWWDANTQIIRGQQVVPNWVGKPGDKVEITGFIANGEIELRKVILR